MTSSSSSEKPYFRSLRTKLTAANAAIMLLLLALQVVIYLWVAQGQVSDSIRLNNSLVDSVGHNADVIYQDTVSQINVVTMNEQLQEQLRYPIGADTENHQANRKIRSLVNERFLSLDTADAIYIRDARSVQRLYWRRTNLPEMIVPTFDFDGVDIPETGWVAADMHAGNLVFVRRILALDNYEYVGDLALVYNKTKLSALLQDLSREAARELTVYDSDGDLIASSVPISEATSLTEARAAEDDSDVPAIFSNGNDLIISSYKSEETGWTMVSAITYSAVTQTARAILTGLMLGTVIVWVVGFLLVRAVAGTITKPLRHMVSVSRSEDTAYTQRYEVDTGDELEALADTLNGLMARTNTLVNQVLRDEIKYREVQLQALQSQINPHMLNNTLEAINWLAELGRKDDIRTVTVAFSKVMDALSDSRRIVTIHEELKLVDDFIEIYEILLMGELTYDVACDEELLDQEVPRLILQPLVENAIIHGIRGTPGGGNVSITITRVYNSDEPRLVITVADDGRGMPATIASAIIDYADDVRSKEAVEPAREVGLGLKNVIDRLNLFYAGTATFDVLSAEGSGSVIELTLPLNILEGEDDA